MCNCPHNCYFLCFFIFILKCVLFIIFRFKRVIFKLLSYYISTKSEPYFSAYSGFKIMYGIYIKKVQFLIYIFPLLMLTIVILSCFFFLDRSWFMNYTNCTIHNIFNTISAQHGKNSIILDRNKFKIFSTKSWEIRKNSLSYTFKNAGQSRR